MWWTSVDCERPDVMSAALLCSVERVLSLYPSSLQPEAYAEARLPRNAVARLRALSDTKIVRSDDARSTTRALLLLPLFTEVRGIEILRTSPFGHSRKFALKVSEKGYEQRYERGFGRYTEAKTGRKVLHPWFYRRGCRHV